MKVLVVDTETTGLGGCPADLVLEVAVAEADTHERTVRRVYSQVVGYDTASWGEELRSSWIFSHSDMTLEEVSGGRPMGSVAREVRGMMDFSLCTSYNVGFDFVRFLFRHPWNVRPRLAPDIMIKAHRLIPGDRVFDDGSTSWPKLAKAYSVLCPDDPAGIDGAQRHRAMEDALMAAHVLLELADRGEYPSDPGDKGWSGFYA